MEDSGMSLYEKIVNKEEKIVTLCNYFFYPKYVLYDMIYYRMVVLIMNYNKCDEPLKEYLRVVMDIYRALEGKNIKYKFFSSGKNNDKRANNFDKKILSMFKYVDVSPILVRNLRLATKTLPPNTKFEKINEILELKNRINTFKTKHGMSLNN